MKADRTENTSNGVTHHLSRRSVTPNRRGIEDTSTWAIGLLYASLTAGPPSSLARRGRRRRRRAPGVLHLPPDDRVEDLRGRDLALGDRHHVFRQHGDVGQLAGCERSFDLLLEPRVRG